MTKKTHKVIDLVYHEDEGNSVFVGTLEECEKYVSTQTDFWTYQIVPMMQEEMKLVNEAYDDHI